VMKEADLKKSGLPVPTLKVLLAEDDPIARRIATRQLAKAGIEVDAVQDGSEAWDKLQKNRYDLLLTDIRMPGIDGIELARRIREMEKQKQASSMPIIGLSAHAMENVVKSCIDAGMNQFMSKPVDPNNIISAILGMAQKPTTSTH